MYGNVISTINFKSKANPIRPFVIKTPKGKLNISEVSVKDIRCDKFMENLTKFFCKNFATATDDPGWRIFIQSGSANYLSAIRNFKKYYLSKLKSNNEHLTLLLARDKNKKIQGACLSFPLEEIPGATQTTCYIDSIAVNPVYRNLNIGRLLLEKTLESAKNVFTDVFLTGDKSAAGFYSSLGFDVLNKNDSFQNVIINYVSKRRFDYPDYIELFTKPLQENAERWYKKSATVINSDKNTVI